jgi:predicted ATPase
MITRLRAKNFKSWKDTGDLRLAPLTGLFGANNSGKTSLLQILLLMQQTVESQDPRQVLYTGDDHSLIDLGTFFDLIHGYDSKATLNLSFTWKHSQDLGVSDLEKQTIPILDIIRELSFDANIRAERDHVSVESFAYRHGDSKFGMSKKGKSEKAQNGQYDLIFDGYEIGKAQKTDSLLPPPFKCYGFPSEAVVYYQNAWFLPWLVYSLEIAFKQISYLGPVREFPEPIYIWGGDSPTDVGPWGEDTIAALLASRAKPSEVSSIEKRVAKWLKKMGMIHSFSLRSIARNRRDYEVRVRITPKSTEVLLTDVGFGVSQILPVLVLCYYVPEGWTILLEQPDIHLHPSVQSHLADVLVDVVKNRHVQIIVESHSEHLLHRLQRRIAEEVISADQVALYFCRMEGGASHIEPLRLDDYGNITNWPENFFGDEMGDLVAMTKAAINRRKLEANGRAGR